MKIKSLLILASVLVYCGCAKHESISRPVILADFKIHTSSGKDIILKSSKISADAGEVYVLSHNNNDDFVVGETSYFVVRIGYYEGESHLLVNGNNGKIIPVDDFYGTIITKKDEAFVMTVGNEAYSPDTGIAFFSIDEEGNFVEQFRLKGLFEEISKISHHNSGEFELKSKRVDPNKPYRNRSLEWVLISYKNRKFIQK